MNYTYIVQCSDGTLYTGWTKDLKQRIKAHNEGKGAKYTRPRRPVRLVYWEAFETKEEAMRREWQIKQLTRKEKLKLCQAQKLKEPVELPPAGAAAAQTNNGELKSLTYSQ